METSPNQSQIFGSQQPARQLPNATLVLVLGILSIIFSCCYGVIGLVMGIIALVQGNKDEKLYLLNPGVYTLQSYKNMKAGKVCGIIGIVLAGLVILLYVVVIAIFGITALSNPQALQQQLNSMH